MTATLSAYAANAAIPTTAASLGIAGQPAVAGSTVPSGSPNARVATSYSSTPAVAGGGPSPAAQVQAVAANSVAAAGDRIRSLPREVNGAAAPPLEPAAVQPQDVARNAAATVSSQFGAPMAADLATAAGGGPISDALNNGVAKIAAFAQNGIKSIERAIQGDMAANNGQVDPAKMQQYTMQMSTFEMIMQMAAKIQESQRNAVQAWLR